MTSSSPPQTLPAPELDVLFVPPAANHRYVRGNDNSLIVERPERINAVLLGIAAVMGRVQASSDNGKGKEREGSSSSLPDTADSLSEAMEQMGLAEDASSVHRPIRVLLSDRDLSLDSPEPAVAFVHAHEDEKVTFLQSAHEKGTGANSPSDQQGAGADINLELGKGSHAAYVQRLCRHAPSAPPTKRPAVKRGTRSSTSTPAKGGGKRATQADGSDSDDDMHASEVPENLNQGDLYLSGGDAHDDLGGSGEAIRKSLGACAEAVDRVVRATTAHGTTPLNSSLPAISFDANANVASDSAPPSKRCFVLTRPPGHHCTGCSSRILLGQQRRRGRCARLPRAWHRPSRHSGH
jgi:histone deacetylase HOS3